MSSKILILGLHRVGQPPKTAKIRGLFTSQLLLSFEILFLKRLGFGFTTLSDALNRSNEKLAVITFDDGYADNYSEGLAVLERFGVPATIFPVTSDVGGRDVVWEEAGEDLPADMLDWPELAELRRRGWEIGTHGHKHVHLDRYSAKEQLRLIRSSIEVIRSRLGHAPVSFAYPYGAFDHATKRALKELGIRFAVTTIPAKKDNLAKRPDLWELKRISIGGRLPHHYAKAIRRTLAAIGIGEVLRSLVPNRLLWVLCLIGSFGGRMAGSAGQYIVSGYE